jgi:hypothetical protein
MTITVRVQVAAAVYYYRDSRRPGPGPPGPGATATGRPPQPPRQAHGAAGPGPGLREDRARHGVGRDRPTVRPSRPSPTLCPGQSLSLGDGSDHASDSESAMIAGLGHRAVPGGPGLRSPTGPVTGPGHGTVTIRARSRPAPGRPT